MSICVFCSGGYRYGFEGTQEVKITLITTRITLTFFLIMTQITPDNPDNPDNSDDSWLIVTIKAISSLYDVLISNIFKKENTSVSLWKAYLLVSNPNPDSRRVHMLSALSFSLSLSMYILGLYKVGYIRLLR